MTEQAVAEGRGKVETPRLTTEAREIEVGKLKIRPQYQRSLAENRVTRIALNYEDNLAGTIEVSFAEGHYWVIDGQHRLAAMRKNGIRVCRVLIHYGLSLAEEAHLFGRLNSERKAVNPRDLYRAELVEGRERSEVVRDTLAKYGLRVSPSKGHHAREIGAIETLWRMQSRHVLDDSLRVVTEAWNDGEGTPAYGALEGRVLGAIGNFIYINRGQDRFDPNRLVTVLTRHQPIELLREARAYSTLTVGARVTLYRWYNHTLQHKLPEIDKKSI